MKVENIIEALNLYIEDIRKDRSLGFLGHIVLQKNIRPNSVFKAYKEYEYTLWFVKRNKKHNILTVRCTDKVIEGHEGLVLGKLDIEFCKGIFSIIESEMFDKLVDGSYGDTD